MFNSIGLEKYRRQFLLRRRYDGRIAIGFQFFYTQLRTYKRGRRTVNTDDSFRLRGLTILVNSHNFDHQRSIR